MNRPKHEADQPPLPPASEVTVRRKPFWKPILRPAQGRRLPPELLPENVFARAEKMSGGLSGREFETLIRRIDQSPFHGDTQIEIFSKGEPVFERILEAIDGAREEILIEAYVLRDDHTGHAMLSSLRSAVARGVEVKLLADAFGSSRTHGDFWRLIRDSGMRMHLFRRPHYAPRSLMPIMDHRKLIIVDRELAFTGGMNIADEYRTGRHGENAWRDTHICLRGGIVWEMVIIFAESWTAAKGDPLHFEGLEPRSSGGVRALVLDARPGRGQNEVFSAYAATMGAARKRLWITNAYFAPGRRMVRLLKQTAARGVDVRLLLPGFCDLPVIRTATQGYYRELMQAGIRIFEYQRAVLHAKTLVADGEVAIIGSTNFDFRSFNFNAECNVLVHDGAVAGQMESIFETDLEQAREISLEDWLARPWYRRLLARLARLVAPLM